jgi:hypothetical protein
MTHHKTSKRLRVIWARAPQPSAAVVTGSRPRAQHRLEIDLDDCVKTNYLKFEEAVAPIPGLAAKED